MRVINSLKTRLIRLPVYGAGADIAMGNILMPGVTAETNDGVLISATEASNADAVGILAELHDYSVSGDALVKTIVKPWFAPIGSAEKDYPARLVELFDAHTLVRVDYDLTGVAATSSSATTVTIGSLEDNIDTAFLYVATAGTGTDDGVVGMLRFVDTSAAGSCTTSVSLGAGDALGAGLVVKILPLFHRVLPWYVTDVATKPVKVATTAAVGTGRALQLERIITRNGLEEQLDPYTHRNLSGLSDLAQFSISGVFQMQDTCFHPVD